MKIHVLPIEPFEERYTTQWLEHWPLCLQMSGFKVEVVTGHVGEHDRETGEFLDIFKTWEWKGSQVKALAERFRWKNIKNGDVILSLDGWGPATTAAAYMRDASGIDVKLVAFFHAGSYDPWDFLARKGMDSWAWAVEHGWFEALDLVLVGSEFHADMLVERRRVDREKIFVCGVPIIPPFDAITPVPYDKRERIVVFPHRIAPEKAPWEFEMIENEYQKIYGEDDSVWVKTRDPAFACSKYDGYTSKRHYYNLLSRARCVVSTARQETFGIAMQEGIALGAWAVAPNRLSYMELINSKNGRLYNTHEQAARAINYFLYIQDSPVWTGYHENAIERAAAEIKGRFNLR